MNSEPANPNPTPPGDSLQFDRAEYAGAALKCAVFGGSIQDQFYQANGQNICPACREKVSLVGVPDPLAFGRATGAGLAAGVGGFLLYWLLLHLFGLQIGLVAIAVGWMVGSAVRWGSRGTGGPPFQILAVAITYLSICSSYVERLLRYSDSLPSAIMRALAYPFEGGMSNIIVWLIIGFGLYEAWILNRKIQLQISGPFSTAKQAPAP
jgi:hypothetical protein